MAQLPTMADVQHVSANPSTRVASYEAGQVEGAQLGQAKATTGMGAELSQYAAQETDKLDNLKVDDRLTQLMSYELDAQKKYQSVKAGGVLDPGYHQESQDDYKTQMDVLASDLTDAQKEKFNAAANRRAVQFDAGRYTYAANEADRYYTTEYSSRVNVLNETGAANYSDPQRLQEASLGVDLATAKELARRGYTDPSDPVVKDEMAKARAGYWGSVLDRAITDGNTTAANSLYSSSKLLLTSDQRKSFESRLKPANDFAEGQQLAVQAHDMLQQGKSMDEIELAISKKATSPGAYNAAQTIFTNFQQAASKQAAEAEGGVLEAFSRGGGNSQAMAQVLSSPDFGKLTEAQRGKIANYMRNEAEQATARAESEGDRRVSRYREGVRWNDYQTEKEQRLQGFKGMETFLTTLEDPNFVNKSRGEIYSLAPVIGKDGVSKLLGEQDSQKSGAQKFQIDKDILEAAIPEKLLDKGNKDKLNAFKGFVESTLMDWKTAHPGKLPSPDEQRKIANSANSEWVSEGFFRDSSYTAYKGPPEAWVEQLQGAAQRKGKVLNQDQIDRAWRAQSLQGK